MVVWLCCELIVICCLQDITREVNLLKEAMHSEGFTQVAEKKRSCISDHCLFFQPVHVIEGSDKFWWFIKSFCFKP